MRRVVSFALVVALFAPGAAAAQVYQVGTPAPLVTAEAEPWFLGGEPITWSGYVYYPAGPQVHFLPNEMVRTGSYHGVPLYTRTTLEPYSVLFVPLSGGLMQPYERRRADDVAGTSGSTVSTLPIEVWPGSSTDGRESARRGLNALGTRVTTGYARIPTSEVPGASVPLRSAGRPHGLNAIFVEFDNHRWYVSGYARPLDPAMKKIGERLGFPVYAQREDGRTIYIPISLDAQGTVAPYTRR